MSRRGFPSAPPSPVPTGKGLRSSAINDDILSDFLTTSLQIPNLKLPIIFQSRRLLTSAVDFRSILSGDGTSVERVMRSVSQFGFFTVSGHEIPVTELQSVAKRIAKNGDEELREKTLRKADEFDFCWAGEEDEDGFELNLDMRPDPNLRICLETMQAGLSKVGQSVGKMFSKTTTGSGIMQRKALADLGILNCNVDYNGRYCENALGLYLPSSKCEVLVEVGMESFVFQAGPDTIVAILGQQLEVDGYGQLTNVPTKLRFVPAEDAQNTLIFWIGLNESGKELDRRISVGDQVLVGALIVLLFQLALWVYKIVQSL